MRSAAEIRADAARLEQLAVTGGRAVVADVSVALQLQTVLALADVVERFDLLREELRHPLLVLNSPPSLADPHAVDEAEPSPVPVAGLKSDIPWRSDTGWLAILAHREFVPGARVSSLAVPLEVDVDAVALELQVWAVLTEDLVGAHAEVYLAGIPALGDLQVFVRTKHGAICVGADQPYEWLQALGTVQTQESGWSSVVVGRLPKGERTVTARVAVPVDTLTGLELQIGDSKQPARGTHTRLPIGVEIEAAVVAL